MQFGVLRISTPLEHSGKPLVGRNPSFFFLPQMMFSIQLKKTSNNNKYKSLKKIIENSVHFVRCQTIQRGWSSFWKPPRSCSWASALLQHIDILNMWRENHKGFNWYFQSLIKRLCSSFFLRVRENICLTALHHSESCRSEIGLLNLAKNWNWCVSRTQYIWEQKSICTCGTLVPNIFALQGNGGKKTRWERLGCLVH